MKRPLSIKFILEDNLSENLIESIDKFQNGREWIYEAMEEYAALQLKSFKNGLKKFIKETE